MSITDIEIYNHFHASDIDLTINMMEYFNGLKLFQIHYFNGLQNVSTITRKLFHSISLKMILFTTVDSQPMMLAGSTGSEEASDE